ncbi:LysR family transcriptional regulator [Ancylobacter sp. 6x-1]|uniref:LysR family transcriptional regulator n=1 Tax=Ancylobacter crimeensis TaxID=2579147 RepID=A0ABT0D834_9HYPH|nr:LysR family transcriptional regulator [Ancylobacter crimeensis]MCK0196107.1 LysR family transcriptional regulator [Ancylobacter crimeensis]
MTLEQLRIFVAVAEREHVTRAAQALNLAQSAASHAIAALEARHDTRLFDRIGRRIVLTEAGRAFLEEGRAVLARAERAEAVLAEFGSLARGTLSLYASQTIASYWLPPRLAAFRRAHPGIAIRLDIGNTAQAAAAVEAGMAELGFVEGEVAAPALAAREVARDRMVLLVAPGHPWAQRQAGRATPAGPDLLTKEDLLAGEWVLREPGSGTRSVFEAALAALGVDPARLDVVLTLPSNEAVRSAVEAGLGASVLSASVAAPSLEAGLLVRVELALPDRAFHLLRHRERRLSRAGEAFAALLGPRPSALRAAAPPAH